MTQGTTYEAFWQQRGRRFARRRNFAYWLEVLLPQTSAWCLLTAVALIIFRIFSLPEKFVWTVAAAGLALITAITWLLSRPRFLGVDQALAEMDHVGQLRNRLTASRAGVGEWPAPARIEDAAKWKWRQIAGPMGIAFLCLMIATALRLPTHKWRSRNVDPPLAMSQVDSWLQTLAESQMIEPEALKTLEQEIEEVKQEGAENWYNQSSLEALDTLRDKVEQEIKRTQNALESSEETLAAAANASDAPPNEFKSLDEALKKAVANLEMGNLPLNKESLSDLKKLHLDNPKQIDPSQLARMRQQLKEGAQVCDKCVGPSVRPGEPTDDASGGPGGGGKKAPLTAKAAPTDLQTRDSEGLTNDDMSRAAIGDMIAIAKGAHQPRKETAHQPVDGGAISSIGTGGEAVWRDSFTPEDRAVLKRYFK